MMSNKGLVCVAMCVHVSVSVFKAVSVSTGNSFIDHSGCFWFGVSSAFQPKNVHSKLTLFIMNHNKVISGLDFTLYHNSHNDPL